MTLTVDIFDDFDRNIYSIDTEARVFGARGQNILLAPPKVLNLRTKSELQRKILTPPLDFMKTLKTKRGRRNYMYASFYFFCYPKPDFGAALPPLGAPGHMYHSRLF